ncbi:membrane glycoprotein [Murid herpesvirus 3]|uniref:Membrane glycoprotein n=2 Tax=Murid betaherpesvirus 3 TaxID=2560603 RepID=A0A1P8VJ12_9BETA|nr:membrane glycoprotein [Murine roseolovirus]APZ76317.1 membrane glycoprotein [Murid betaherpesvirus 3]AYH64772.1 membrane glycoprotein [Murid herpesvirus 3]
MQCIIYLLNIITLINAVTYVHLNELGDFCCEHEIFTNITEIKWVKYNLPIFSINVTKNINVAKGPIKVKNGHIQNTLKNKILRTCYLFYPKNINDQGTYTCIFQSYTEKYLYDHHIKVNMNPLIYLRYKYIENILDVTCTVTAFPKPTVVASFMNKVYTSNKESLRKNGNGTYTATLKIIFKKNQYSSFNGELMTCIGSGGLQIRKKSSIIIPSFESHLMNVTSSGLKKDIEDSSLFTTIISCLSIVFCCLFVILTVLCKYSYR